MNGSPDEVAGLAHGQWLIESAPIPITVKRQRRIGLSRLILGHLLKRGELHVSLGQGRLFILCRQPWKIRHIQHANLISEAIALLGVDSLPPFYMNSDDKPGLADERPATRFGNCAVSGNADVAAPCFSFNGWTEARFEDFDAKARLLLESSSVSPVHDRAFWTGRVDNPAREALLEQSRGHPEKIEAIDSTAHYDGSTNLYRGVFKPMEEQVAKFRYMIDIEGFGFSARLKLLLHAARVLLMIDRPYQEYFYKDMEPFRHYVPVARDSSDLLDRIDWLRSNPAREAEIIKEAQHFARTRLTRKAAIEKWAELLEEHRKAGGKLRSGVEHLPS